MAAWSGQDRRLLTVHPRAAPAAPPPPGIGDPRAVDLFQRRTRTVRLTWPDPPPARDALSRTTPTPRRSTI